MLKKSFVLGFKVFTLYEIIKFDNKIKLKSKNLIWIIK